MANENEKQALRTESSDITNRFLNAVRSHQIRDGRHVVPRSLVLDYITELLEAIGPDVGEDIPGITLDSIWIEEPVTFPVGNYPRITLNNSVLNEAVFENITFTGIANFFGMGVADNGKSVTFKNVRFLDTAFFESSKLGRGSLTDATFDKDAVFKGARLSAFVSCLFRGHASFEGIAIETLDNCTFESELSMRKFQSSVFSILKSKFFGLTAFDHGKVIGESVFYLSSFFKEAGFNNTSFIGPTVFDNVVFRSQCHFNSAEFLNSTHFRFCTFNKAPEFYNVELYPNTSLYTSKFSAFHTEADWSAYRQLRHLAIDKMKSPAEEGRFFQYEQRTRANLDLKQSGNRFAGAVSKAYDWASEYSQNIVRPLVLIFVVNIAITLAYFGLSGHIVRVEGEAGLAFAANPEIGFMLQNVFAPFSFLSKQTVYSATCWTTVALGIGQSLLTLALFALWLLALRRRFRKGSE